jgi:tetratricopeptide (TPR) repeat protein
VANETQGNSLRQQIYSRMQEKDTEELLDIWNRNDREEWSDDAFEIIHNILLERLGSVPEQADAEGHLERAYEYEDTAELEKALRECNAAIEVDPSLSDAYNLRGIVLEELGREEEAVEAYRQAIRLDPEFYEAKDNLFQLVSELAARHQLTTIARFSYPTEAYILKARLETEGIPSFIADEYTVTIYWLYSNAIGGVKLQVKRSDVERALEILNQEPEGTEWIEDEFGEGDDQPQCSKCGSVHTYYEKYAMRLVFLSWLILCFPLPILKRKWKCADCGHIWKLKKETV